MIRRAEDCVQDPGDVLNDELQHERREANRRSPEQDAEVEAIAAAAAKRAESPIVTLWAPPRDLTQRPSPRRYLMRHPDGDGFLPRGKAGSIVAGGGTGKTMSLCQLAVSVVVGRPWLGHFIVDDAAGRVLLVLAEEDHEEAHRRLWEACEAMRITDEERWTVIRRLTLLPLAGNHIRFVQQVESGYRPTEHLTALHAQIAENAPDDGWSLIAIDPLSRVGAPGLDRDSDAGTATVQALEGLVKSPGQPTVLVAHHSSKSATSAGKADSRGVTALTDGFRFELGLAPKNAGSVTLSLRKSNYTKPMPDLELVRRPGGLLEVSVYQPATLTEEEAFEAEMTNVEKIGRRMLAALRRPDHVGWVRNQTDALLLTFGNKTDKRQAWKYLVQREWVHNVGPSRDDPRWEPTGKERG